MGRETAGETAGVTSRRAYEAFVSYLHKMEEKAASEEEKTTIDNVSSVRRMRSRRWR